MFEIDRDINESAAWLYHGKVMHARLSPRQHRFQYSVYSLLIDIDQLDQASKLSSIFSINRFNLVSFYPSDHMVKGCTGTLRQHVEACLNKESIRWTPSRILLACYPRILGRVFNPLSVFYIYKENQKIGAMIYEVRNTFGEKHLYVLEINSNDTTNNHIRQQVDKNFYVSPFMQMNMRYFFIMSEPYKKMSWRIIEKQQDIPMLSATYLGTQTHLSTANLARFFLQIPLLTWKILGGIHFEALKLWLKGLKYVPRKSHEKSTS
jgi:hypothetical protein